MVTDYDFLASEYPASSPQDAWFHVIPVPLEQTVSYGPGTARGPAAILQASQQLEAYDGVSYPGEAGIYTAAPIDCDAEVATVLPRIQAATEATLRLGKIPVLLGGEHSLTQAPVAALKKRYDNLGVVQIDAHADLRDTFEGSPYSHACVMRRVVEMGVPLFQIGVRNLCREEIAFRRDQGISYLDAVDLHQRGLPESLLPADFPHNLYLSFDIDGLDASLMPATGTPEPGGLMWWQALSVMERAVVGRRVVGMDVVELAPQDGLHSADYIAAKLTYAMMGVASRRQSG